MTDILVTTPIPLNSNVTVVNPTPLNQEVLSTQPIPVVLVTGSAAQLLTQSTPSSSWSFTNPLGRLCGVDIYISGEQVEADVTVTSISINVTFAEPQSGVIVIT